MPVRNVLSALKFTIRTVYLSGFQLEPKGKMQLLLQDEILCLYNLYILYL